MREHGGRDDDDGPVQHHHHHFYHHIIIDVSAEIDRRLTRNEDATAALSSQVASLTERTTTMALDMTKLNAAIERQTTVSASLREDHNKLKAQLAEALLSVGVTQAQIDAAEAKVVSDADADAALLVANTPAEPDPVPAPAPTP